MKKLALIAAVLFAVVTQFGFAAAQTGRVVIYSEVDFRGDSLSLTSDWRGGGKFDRNVKSIRVPKGYRVTLYGATSYGGAETVLTEDWNPGAGAFWTTRVRSIRVDATATQLPENPGGAATQLPENPDGTATHLPDFQPVPTTSFPVLYAGTKLKGPSETIERDRPYLTNWDGSPRMIRSILVPAGWYLVVYARKNFRGQSYNISSDVTFAPGDQWYNRIRSIRLYKGKPPPQPR